MPRKLSETAKQLTTTERKHFKTMFTNWNGSYTKIAQNKYHFELKDPKSKQKVCLFSDETHAYIYGNYGSFDFNELTESLTPWNIKYDNIDYVIDQLSQDSYNHIHVFTEKTAITDISTWLRRTLTDFYDIAPKRAYEITMYLLKEYITSYYPDAVFDKYKEAFNAEPAINTVIHLLNTITRMTPNDDSNRYIYLNALYDCYDELSQIEELFESSLLNAGVDISKAFYLSVYALEILSYKIKP